MSKENTRPITGQEAVNILSAFNRDRERSAKRILGYSFPNIKDCRVSNKNDKQ